MVHVRLEAKKKWNKNEKLYPYFNYSIFKKIFLLGLKGALNRFIVVLTFIAHIATLLMIVFCVLVCCLQNIALAYCFRVLCGVELFLMLSRLGCQIGFPLNL